MFFAIRTLLARIGWYNLRIEAAGEAEPGEGRVNVGPPHGLAAPSLGELGANGCGGERTESLADIGAALVAGGGGVSGRRGRALAADGPAAVRARGAACPQDSARLVAREARHGPTSEARVADKVSAKFSELN
jgi:hypothetical protein